MKPLAHEPKIRIERLAPGENGAAWAAAVRAFDPAAATLLKRDGGTAVYWTRLLGREVVLKSWELGGVGNRLKELVRASRGHRHWRGAERLEAIGLATARCFVLATQYGAGVPRQWLVMEHLPGKTVLQHLADGDLGIRGEHALARELGEMVTRFGRWFNRDHKPSNLIVFRPDGPEPMVAVIDCVAIRRRGGRSGARMLAALVIEPMGVGHPPRRTLMARALRGYWASTERQHPGTQRQGVRAVWKGVRKLVENHGDPRPRINPLAAESDPAGRPATPPATGPQP